MVILINGSPRKNGATSSILKYISAMLESQSLETEIVQTADLNLQYCLGCCKCYKTGKCIWSWSAISSTDIPFFIASFTIS